MSTSTTIFNTPGTYDLNSTYSGYGTYAIDCTAGNIVISMQQSFASGLFYQLIRVDSSSNTLTLNAYSGDTMNNTGTSINVPPLTNIWCQTVASGNWLVPFETITYPTS